MPHEKGVIAREHFSYFTGFAGCEKMGIFTRKTNEEDVSLVCGLVCFPVDFTGKSWEKTLHLHGL